MAQHITSPEQAKELLKGTTSRPWVITTTKGIAGIGFAEEFYTDNPPRRSECRPCGSSTRVSRIPCEHALRIRRART